MDGQHGPLEVETMVRIALEINCHKLLFCLKIKYLSMCFAFAPAYLEIFQV